MISPSVHTQKNLVDWVDASNLERGLFSLPVELTTEILDYFPTTGSYIAVYYHNFSLVLVEIFLVRVGIVDGSLDRLDTMTSPV